MTVSTAQIAAPGVTTFDGVICFGGEDWWYHNRGHFDMQVMRELSAAVPVLYINSIGMRVPKPGEGRMFVTRVRRKLRSICRGRVSVRPGFAVMSPLAFPGRRGAALNRVLLPRQILRASRAVGIKAPLVWVACPPGVEVLDLLDPAAVVYQRTDRFEAFPHVDQERITRCDRLLKDRADLTLFCSRQLCEAEAPSCQAAMFVDHGVDYSRFAEAGVRATDPDEIASIPRPRVGFVGGIDAHTFDPPLFLEIARRLPEMQFVLVGACSLPEGWCQLPNVSLLGQRPYESVPDFMAACDVLIMPWNQSEWIRACNPVKLKEYLAVGRPVVSTPFDELANYEGLVEVALGSEAFAEAIERCLATFFDPSPGRRRVERETWSAKAARIRERLAALGIQAGVEAGWERARPRFRGAGPSDAHAS